MVIGKENGFISKNKDKIGNSREIIVSVAPVCK